MRSNSPLPSHAGGPDPPTSRSCSIEHAHFLSQLPVPLSDARSLQKADRCPLPHSAPCASSHPRTTPAVALWQPLSGSKGFFTSFATHLAGFRVSLRLRDAPFRCGMRRSCNGHVREVTLMRLMATTRGVARAMNRQPPHHQVGGPGRGVPTGTQPGQVSADQIRCSCDPGYLRCWKGWLSH
jgi:hypothetical protein